jgi:hypothetical protein
VVAVNEPLRRWMRPQAGRFWLIVAGLFLLPTVYACLVVLWSGLF